MIDRGKEIVKQQVLGLSRSGGYPSGSSHAVIKFRDRATQRYFVERIIKASKGIPFTAVEMCKRAMGVEKVSMTFVREHLMAEHEASMKWIDASPILFNTRQLLSIAT